MSSDGIELESNSDIKMKASGDIIMEGTNIELKASAGLNAEGGASAAFTSSGSTEIQGSIVQIN